MIDSKMGLDIMGEPGVVTLCCLYSPWLLKLLLMDGTRDRGLLREQLSRGWWLPAEDSFRPADVVENCFLALGIGEGGDISPRGNSMKSLYLFDIVKADGAWFAPIEKLFF